MADQSETFDNFYKKVVNGRKGNLFTRVDSLETMVQKIATRNISNYITNVISQSQEIIMPSIVGGTTDPTSASFSGVIISPKGIIIGGISYSFAIVQSGVVVSGMSTVTYVNNISSDFVFDNETGLIFKDTLGNTATGTLVQSTAPSNDFVIQNRDPGAGISFAVVLTNATAPYVKWYEKPTEINTALLEINAATTPTQVLIGNAISLSANLDGKETVFNETSYDTDFRIESATDPNAFKLDAGLETIAMFGTDLVVNGTANTVSIMSGDVIVDGGTEHRLEIGADHYIPTRNSSNKTTYFNEANQDMDFNVQGSTDGNLLFIDASTDRVGIGIATPATKLDVNGTAKVSSLVWDNWISDVNTWTYASASTFTISGDYTAVYTAGTKIKWTQTSVKYGVVLSSSYAAPNTTVTIAVNTDYTIANAAISANYYSYAISPPAFPEYFNFAVSWTNVTVGNGTVAAKYSIQGKQVDFFVSLKWGTTTAFSGNVSLAPPITALNYTQAYMNIGGCSLIDWGVSLYTGVVLLMSTTSIEIRAVNSSGTYTSSAYVTATVPHTWGDTDLVTIVGRYFI